LNTIKITSSTFLDLKKDIDYDAKIEDKADFMKDGSLNRYYYSIAYDLLDWERG
jgi:hypothetical protein